MNATLETALSRIAALPEAEQELAAELLQQFAARHDASYKLNSSERTAVRTGLEDTTRKDFASEAATNDLLRKPWR